MKLYNLYKTLYEDEELYFFRDEWYPTNQDWYAMIMNLNKHANFDNIFKKVSVFNIEKMIRCYEVARAIGWPNIEKYNAEIRKKFMHNGGIRYDEFELIDNEFIEIPKDWEELILDLEQNDKLGGVAMRHQDMGEFSEDAIIFKTIEKYLQYEIKSIKFYRIHLDNGNFHPNQRIVKFNLKNGSIAYFKIKRWNSNSYDLKGCDSESRNITASRFQTDFQIYLNPYIDGLKSDPEYLLQTL